MVYAQACRTFKDAQYRSLCCFLHKTFHLGFRCADQSLVKQLAVVEEEKPYARAKLVGLRVTVHPLLAFQ
jgi:hypothetical protein